MPPFKPVFTCDSESNSCCPATKCSVEAQAAAHKNNWNALNKLSGGATGGPNKLVTFAAQCPAGYTQVRGPGAGSGAAAVLAEQGAVLEVQATSDDVASLSSVSSGGRRNRRDRRRSRPKRRTRGRSYRRRRTQRKGKGYRRTRRVRYNRKYKNKPRRRTRRGGSLKWGCYS
jgi:hypothetical protein